MHWNGAKEGIRCNAIMQMGVTHSQLLHDFILMIGLIYLELVIDEGVIVPYVEWVYWSISFPSSLWTRNAMIALVDAFDHWTSFENWKTNMHMHLIFWICLVILMIHALWLAFPNVNCIVISMHYHAQFALILQSSCFLYVDTFNYIFILNFFSCLAMLLLSHFTFGLE